MWLRSSLWEGTETACEDEAPETFIQLMELPLVTLLKSWGIHLPNPRSLCPPSGTRAGWKSVTTVEKICPPHTSVKIQARKTQWKPSHVTIVRKHLTLKMILTITFALLSNVINVRKHSTVKKSLRITVHLNSIAHVLSCNAINNQFKQWPIGQFGRQCLHSS